MSARTTSIPKLITQWREVTARPAAPPPPVGAESVAVRRRKPVRRPIECLKDMLRAAIRLEFATIPPYLAALWSIKEDLHPVAKSIREVLHEEMLHLALTCNLLAALGDAPDLIAAAPSYPGPLPGDVHPDLSVELRGLDDQSLKDFVRIESPTTLPDNVERHDGDPQPPKGDTIGELYESILAAFRHIRPVLSVDGQITGPLSWRVIATPADVESAIRLIQRQGEGALLGPLDAGKQDLAHYYRFLEVLKQKRLVYDPARRMHVWAPGYERPKVWPTGPVPKDGYPDASDDVKSLLDLFDRRYSAMLDHLNLAWGKFGQGNLIHAIDLMFELEKTAKPLMQIRVPGKGDVTYGPRFRYVAKTQASGADNGPG